MQNLTKSPYSYTQNRINALLAEIEKHGDSVPESIREIAEAEDFRQIKTGETIICNFGVWGADDLQDSLESAEASDASTADRIEILKRIALTDLQDDDWERVRCAVNSFCIKRD